MSDLLTELARWIAGVIYAFGYAGVFVLVALPYLNIPVPTELTLPFAGFLVGQGRFSFVPVLVASTAGAVVASLIVYYLGRWIGERRLRRLVKRVERFRLVSGADLDRASALFERHGGKAIFVGHLYDDTVFVIYGDHGEGFGEHGLFQHDNVPYEEGLKVPLLVHDPRWCENGCESGGRVEAPTSQLDILPTVADLLGYGIEGGAYQGYSLLRSMPADRPLMFSCWNESGCMASIKGNEKYIYHFEDKPEEVFDLSKDPLEKQNLADQYSPEELEERRTELLEWRAKVNSRYGGARSD